MEEYGAEAEYDEYKKWEVRANEETLDFFDTKKKAITYLLVELDTASNERFLNNTDEEELLYELIELCSDDFYNIIDGISEEYNIDIEFKLINLDNEEPEFGEL